MKTRSTGSSIRPCKRRVTHSRRWVGAPLLLVLAALLWALPAQADKVAAEKLFQEGRALMDAGQTEQACLKFKASMEAERSVGAMLNLALCHETLGKTASAWAEYSEAADLARHANQEDRAQGAAEAIARLEPVLSHLTIQVDDRSDGLVVLRDQSRVVPGTFGTSLPIDPGDHVIEARAPGKQPWTTTVQIPHGPSAQTVVVPLLAAAGPPAAPAPGHRPSMPPSGGDSAPSSGLNGAEIAGITLMAVGAVGLGVGIGAGLVAMGEQQSLDDDLADDTLCPGPPTGCAEAQSRADDDIKPIAHVSTAGFVIGGAAMVGGLVVFLLAPDEDEQAAMVLPSVGPSSAGLALTGSF